MKPKIAVIIAQLIFLLFFTVLISNSWDFYFWPTFSVVAPRNNKTLSVNFSKENEKYIWVDEQKGKFQLVTYGKQFNKNLERMEGHFKNKTELTVDICKIGSEQYFFNINTGDQLIFAENDVIEKISEEKESTLNIIIFSGILSLISCWVIFEIKNGLINMGQISKRRGQ